MFKKLSIIAIFTLLLACGNAFAASNDPCGELTASQAPIWSDHNGYRKDLSVGSSVYEFDVVKTGEGGSGTVAFIDGTVLELRESSEFSIMEVELSEKRSRFNINLVEGAFRAVTGEIVKRNPRGFKVSTSGAMVGIRGTDLEVSYNTSTSTTSVNVASTEHLVVVTDRETGVSISGGSGLSISISSGGSAVINGIDVDLNDVGSIEAAVSSLEGTVSFTDRVGDAVGVSDAPSVGAGSEAGTGGGSNGGGDGGGGGSC